METPAKRLYDFTPEQLAEAKREEEQLAQMFSRMDAHAHRPITGDPERLHTMLRWGVGILIAAAVTAVLAFRVDSPSTLITAAISLAAGLFLLFGLDERTPLLLGLGGSLVTFGIFGVLLALLKPPDMHALGDGQFGPPGGLIHFPEAFAASQGVTLPEAPPPPPVPAD